VFVVLYYSGDVFIDIIFPVVKDDGIAILDCKNSLDMDLRVGVCHRVWFYIVPDGTIVN
jgi:hypothetical protein